MSITSRASRRTAILLPLIPAAVFGLGTSVQAATLIIGNGTSGPFTPAYATANFGANYQITTAASVFKDDITAANSYSAGVTVKQYLESFSLVVIGGNAGSYDRDGWAGVTTGMISISPFQTRNDRLGWFSTGATEQPVNANITDTSLINTTHPIVAGLSNPANIYADGGGFTLQMAVIGGSFGGGTRIGTLTLPDQPTISGDTIAAWNAGDLLGGTSNGPNNTAGTVAVAGPRVFFAISQNVGNANELLSDDGRQAFQNAITFATVPEPSSAALLIGASGCLLLRRRRA